MARRDGLVDTAARRLADLPQQPGDGRRQLRGATTVASDPTRFAEDPFARLFTGTTVKIDLFSAVAPPAGPVVERYTGAPWPAGSFGTASALAPIQK